jgi:hypothetical protein
VAEHDICPALHRINGSAWPAQQAERIIDVKTNEMKVQQRFGLERLPVVTMAVFAVTAVMNGLQVAVIAALVGAELALAQDIHGAALVAGIVIAALLTLVVRERTAGVQA